MSRCPLCDTPLLGETCLSCGVLEPGPPELELLPSTAPPTVGGFVRRDDSGRYVLSLLDQTFHIGTQKPEFP